MPKTNGLQPGEDSRKERQRLIIAGVAGLVVLVLLLFFLPNKKATQTKEVALHFADSWKDIGAIDGCLFFRDGKDLIAFDAGGKRWATPLDVDTKPIYGDKIYLLQKDRRISVRNPQTGKEERTIQEEGLLGLMTVEKTAFSPATVIGIKADRFVLFDKEGNIQAVQKTSGAPGLLAQTDTHIAWTEEGAAKGVTVSGQVEKAPGFSSPRSTTNTPQRSVLVMRATTPEKDEPKSEGQDPLIGGSFQLNADVPFTRLLWTDKTSFVVAQESRLYFVVDHAVTATVPCGKDWDMTANEEGLWVTDGRALTCYAPDGKAKKTIALDFPPLRVISSRAGIVVVGKNRRMTLKDDKKEAVDTQELIRVLPQADGATMLVYREAFFVLP